MLAFTILSVFSACILTPASAHDHVTGSLPGKWYHEDDHPAHKLFRRGPTDGATYPVVGSSAWLAAYPSSDPTNAIDKSKVPAAWLNALNAAVAAGKIPDIPISTQPNGEYTTPVYNKGTLSFDDPTVCSANAQTCQIPGDIWDAPTGVVGIGFDDGPTPYSDKLLDFLASNKQAATHFFIGANILRNPTQFLKAFNNGNDIAVHTWSHHYLTTLTNEAIVGELGWTVKLIHDSTGGRLPKYWRPPYGDTDRRVHAIASVIFGMTTVMWNQDTNDYAIPSGGQTSAKVASLFHGWLSGPKNPGLLILEHELYAETVSAFISAWPEMKSAGWNTVSQARMYNYTGTNWQNSVDNNSTVTPVNDVILAAGGSISIAPASSASNAAAGFSSSGSMVRTLSASSSSVTGQVSTQFTGGAVGLLPMHAMNVIAGVAMLMILL